MDATAAFLQASDSVSQEYVGREDPAWDNSRFRWIRMIPSSRSRGAAAERLAEAWLVGLGFSVTRAGNSDADRIVNGHPVEIKFSTPWSGSEYAFQQLRDQDYEYALLLGVSPDAAHAWFVPKAALTQHVIGVTGQHGGRAGRDTAWIRFVPATPPSWLQLYGGTLTKAAEVISASLK